MYPRRSKLKHDLGLLDVFCISSGAMISSGLFVLPALAYLKAGPAILLSYALASILVIPTVLAKSELITALPRTGGIFIFTDRSMGPLVGTLAGLSAWFSLAFKTAFALLGMGIFITLIFPELSILQLKLLAVFFCLIFMAINIIGVKITGKVQSFLVMILFVIMFIYMTTGIFFVRPHNFYPFLPKDLSLIFSTAGLIFVAFSGTTKIAAIAEEVKEPQRTIPLGIFLSWGVVSILYMISIFILLGVTEPSALQSSLTPFSLAGGIIMGPGGVLIMSIAALLAFITTANAGILAASRDPYAMGHHKLLPSFFAKLSKQGTPWVSILFTTFFMILVILFLDLELFIKTASTLKLVLFTIANLTLIYFRYKGNKKHYRPSFHAPLFPWLQLIGIAFYIYLIYKMGLTTLLITTLFLIAGVVWYYLFAHKCIQKEYKLIRKIKKVADIRYNDYFFFEETREMFFSKTSLVDKALAFKLKNCVCLDLVEMPGPAQFYKPIARKLAKKLQVPFEELYLHFINKDRRFNVIVEEKTAIIFIHVKEYHKFELALVTSSTPFLLSKKIPQIKNALVVVASHDHKELYYHSLFRFFELLENPSFQESWSNTDNNSLELKKILTKQLV